jgi:phage tail sheath protein FI
MAYNHGVSISQADTSVSTPVVAQSGIALIIGTAPVHILPDGQPVGGKVNEPILCLNYNEAVSALGYSEDWEKYTLCEAIFSQFKLYGVSPSVFVNVLDPAVHKSTQAADDYPIVDKKVLLPLEAIKDSVSVTGYNSGDDYELFYDGENLVLEIIDGGAIPADLTTLNIGFTYVDPSQVTENDIIGGFNTTTKKYSGLELIDSVFPKYSIVTDLIIAPGWSQNSTVAAIMSAKAQNINGIFEGKAIIDVDTEAVAHYSDAPQWKKDNNINSKYQILCYPMVKLGDRKFHLSTQAAFRMVKTDTDNGGCPSESPSNKLLQIDGVILKDGTEILLDNQQANYLNSNGIVTALNFIGGYVLWGNETACYPANTDIKNYFTCVSRMFGWVGNSLVLSHWSKVDKPMTRRLIDTIIDSANIWFNGLVSEGKLLGGRVEFLADENSDIDIMAGRMKFHIYITPPSPAKEIAFVLEYDVGYLSAALQ